MTPEARTHLAATLQTIGGTGLGVTVIMVAGWWAVLGFVALVLIVTGVGLERTAVDGPSADRTPRRR